MANNKIYIDGNLHNCERCQNSDEMLIAITNKVKDKTAKTQWLGGYLQAIYCPFCGRKLKV